MESRNNLHIFKILFIVKGVLNLLFALIPLFYLFLGSMIPPEEVVIANGGFNMSDLFKMLGLIGFSLVIILAAFTFVAANLIEHRRNYTLLFVIAIVNALTGILGIILCIFFLIELNKPEVKAEFQS